MSTTAACILTLLLPLGLSASAAFGLAATSATAQTDGDSGDKVPVPAEEAVAAARDELRAKFADKLAKATTRKQFQELSGKLLELATSLRDDPVARHAALLEARDLAVKARDCKLALGIVERLHRWYAPLDEAAWRRGVVLGIAGDPRLQPGEIPEVVGVGLQMLEECLAREEAQASAELWEALRAPIKKAKDEPARQRHAAAEKELGYLRGLERLQTDPTDGEANFVVGWHVAFVKDRLLEGIERLALASDPHEAVRHCARLDLAHPKEAAAQVEVGDAWVAWAKTQAEGPRALALRRAESWYFLAHRQLAGTQRNAVVEKLRKIAAQSTPAPSSSGARSVPARNDPAMAEVGESIERALSWLALHQSPDGRWSAAGFARQCSKNDCGGLGNELFDTGLTGLAVLCFLRAGETSESKAFGSAVKRGLEYLTGVQERPGDGCFGERVGQHWVYGHACATIAMAEAHASTRDAACKASAQRAIDFVQAAQNPYAAWRYSYPPDGDNDASVTGWMVTALSSARASGLRIAHESAFANAQSFIDLVTDPLTGRTGYTALGQSPSRLPALLSAFPPESSESLTAVGMVVRFLNGRTPEGATGDGMLQKGADLLARSLPRWSGGGALDFYYWYYGTFAMRFVGGKRRDAWNDALRAALVGHQRVDEAQDEYGSWDPVDAWSAEGGRVYATVLNCLSLEIYHRQLVTGR